MRWFLIDKVTEFAPGERARGTKNVTLTDEVLHDHFPDHPIFPGVLVVEGMAQLAGFLIEMSVNRPEERPRRALLTQIREAKFHDTSGPGDRLEFEVRISSVLGAAAQVTGEATADGRRIARAELTFFLKDVESERVHEQRRNLYTLWTRDLKLDRPIL